MWQKFKKAATSGKSFSVRQASILLVITTFLSNALGLLRNIVFYRFVSPEQLDIYFASFKVADFLFNILIFSAITSAFIPVISGYIAENKEEKAREVTSKLLTVATLAFGLLIALLWIIMPTLIHKLVPGFDVSRIDQTIQLSRLMLFQTIFFSWSFIIGSYLNGSRRFTSYSLAPLTYNLSLIVGGFLASRFGILAITYSVIIGSFLHFFIQYQEALRIGFRYKFLPTLDREIKEIFKLMLPRSLASGMTQIVPVAYTGLASNLQAGSIAVFSGMNDLQTAPTTIIGNSLATAFFPELSGLVAKKDYARLNLLVTEAIQVSIFILLPLISLTYILRAQIVRLYFGIGGASWQLTELGISTLVFFLIGIIPAVLVALFARIFYANKNTRTPMWIAGVTSLLGILVAYFGINVFHFNVAALAFAESCISIMQMLWYAIALHKSSQLNVGFKQILLTTHRSIASALIAGFTAWITLHFVNYIYEITGLSTTKTIALFFQALIAGMAGIGLYLWYIVSSKQPEFQWLKKSFTRTR